MLTDANHWDFPRVRCLVCWLNGNMKTCGTNTLTASFSAVLAPWLGWCNQWCSIEGSCSWFMRCRWVLNWVWTVIFYFFHDKSENEERENMTGTVFLNYMKSRWCLSKFDWLFYNWDTSESKSRRWYFLLILYFSFSDIVQPPSTRYDIRFLRN